MNLKVKNKKPLVHFFILGLVVFGLRAWFEKPARTGSNKALIEITSADLEWFRTLFKKRMGRDPTVEELEGQVSQLVREQVLSREAERLGLDENDPIVQRRLSQKVEYLFKDMAAAIQPSEEELQTFLETYRNRYEIPGETTFEQVLFTTDQRGFACAELAVTMFLDHPTRESDATMLPRVNENMSSVQIAGIFGRKFQEKLSQVEPGKWEGPIQSGYGLHAVFVEKRSPSLLPSVDDIRERLVADWSADKQTQTATEAYNRLRRNYRVLVEGMPYDHDMK